jgi:hypothetical protein
MSFTMPQWGGRRTRGVENYYCWYIVEKEPPTFVSYYRLYHNCRKTGLKGWVNVLS